MAVAVREYWKEIVVAVSIATFSFLIQNAISKNAALEKEVILLRSQCDVNTQDLILVKKSRESLSDYYVTRREFNSYMKDFEKKVDQQDSKLEKILDILIEIKK